MTTPEWLVVGFITKPQGLRGEARVKIKTDFPEKRFAPNSSLSLSHPDFNTPLAITVEYSRPHKGVYIVKFREFDSIEQIEKLRGAEIRVATRETHELEENAYYFYEIIGCDVFTVRGEHIGVITEIWQPGANDVWVVKRDHSAKDLYLPYIDDVVKQVLPEQKRVVIEWMDGLE